MEPSISVIIPVYNTEEYIGICMQSVLKNVPQDAEIICINDGSKDKSFEICQEYAKEDKRIMIINQDNQGVSVARNKGMDIAKGKWIMFVDSDDVLLKSDFELSNFQDSPSDVIIFDVVWGKKVIYEKEKPINFGQKDSLNLIERVLLSKPLTDKSSASLRSPCAKAYRRDFLMKYGIRFPLGIKIGEDLLFNISVLSRAENIEYMPIDIYRVTERNGSATHSYVENMIENDLLFQRELRSRLEEAGMFEKMALLYDNEVRSGILRCCRKCIFHSSNKGSYKEKKYQIQNILNAEIYQDVLTRKDNNIKRRIILFMLKNKCVTMLRIIFRIESSKTEV